MAEGESSTARCPSCRNEVAVPESYAHGDHINCRVCGSALKVQRGGGLRLLLADLGPLKESLALNREQLERLEDELRGAQGSIGMGTNGLWVGLAYVLYKVGLRAQEFSAALIATGVVIALVCAVALEVLNYFFLSKRRRIERLTEEIQEVRREGRELRQKLREATRG